MAFGVGMQLLLFESKPSTKLACSVDTCAQACMSGQFLCCASDFLWRVEVDLTIWKHTGAYSTSLIKKKRKEKILLFSFFPSASHPYLSVWKVSLLMTTRLTKLSCKNSLIST